MQTSRPLITGWCNQKHKLVIVSRAAKYRVSEEETQLRRPTQTQVLTCVISINSFK